MDKLTQWVASCASFPPPPEQVLALYAAEIELRARLYLGADYDAWKAGAEALANDYYYGDAGLCFPREAWERLWRT